jgi:hypothetical protein
MIVLIGMAVGVDYSLFYLKREREERAKGHSTRDAVEIAAQTSGHSILVSGAAVICAMAGLFVIGDSTFNSLAVGAILVVAVAVLGSIPCCRRCWPSWAVGWTARASRCCTARCAGYVVARSAAGSSARWSATRWWRWSWPLWSSCCWPSLPLA